MELINTNRLRVTVRRMGGRDKPMYKARGSYKSNDHGAPRLDTTWYFIRPLWQVTVKWRPDGKRGHYGHTQGVNADGK